MHDADQQVDDLAAPSKSNSATAAAANPGLDDMPPEQQAGMNAIALQLSCMEHLNTSRHPVVC